MAEYSVMDRINMIISDPDHATMTLSQIVTEEIREFKASEQYANMIQAEAYYRNRTDVQRKTNDVANRSNTRIEHPILKKLVDQKATLMYFKDVDYTSPHFRMVQYLGLRGYLPEWTARLQEPVDMATLTAWKKLSGKDLPGIEAGKTTRLVALEMIYRKIK